MAGKAGCCRLIGEPIAMKANEFEQLPPSGVVTAMFTDIVNSVALKEKMPGATSANRDESFRASIKTPHDEMVLRAIQAHNGYLVNPTGDGFCVTFVDAEEAVLCALQIQQGLYSNPIKTPDGALQLRIGLHTGIAGPESGDYTASTIDKTARIQGLASPGTILLSLQTYVLVANTVRGARFTKAGTFDIKGMRTEELYVVVPDDIPLAQSGAPQSETRRLQPASRTSGTALLTAAAILLLSSGAVFVWFRVARPRNETAQRTASASAAILHPGDHWQGTFRFLPPIQNYTGPAALIVESTSGDTFEGIYSTENEAWRWRVRGTMNAGYVRWQFVQPLKTKGIDEATGKALVECKVSANRMSGFYRSNNGSNEAAEILLQIGK